ncbi:MAG: hypothetical protein AAB360_00235 [Patescibacteria group bacterium]
MEITGNDWPIRSLLYSVPARAALAGNPSDLAMEAGIGAVLAMPLWGLQATVSFLPSDRFYIRGPEPTHWSFSDFVNATRCEGVDDAERLFRGTSLAFARVLRDEFGRLENEIRDSANSFELLRL